jgi:hypothetical protein
MNTHAILYSLCLLGLCLEARAADDNPVFADLTQKGVVMSDSKFYKLPMPAMAETLDAAGQKAAIEKISAGHYSYAELSQKSSSAPVLMKIRTLNAAEGQSTTVRAIDAWFIAHGKWETLNSKEFLDSLAKGKDTEGENRIVSKSGILTDEETRDRKLLLQASKGLEAKFVYATFSLFDQVEVSATRYSVVARGKNNLLVAGRIDPRFNSDKDYPNQWRPILRDAAANVSLGPPQPYAGAGAYANVVRLVEPADAIFVEGHIVFEEPYGWFEGGNELRSKAPAMIRQRVKVFRAKFAIASEKQK